MSSYDGSEVKTPECFASEDPVTRSFTSDAAIVTMDVYEVESSLAARVKSAESLEELLTLWTEFREDSYYHQEWHDAHEVFARSLRGKITSTEDIESARDFIDWEDETIPVDVLKSYFADIRDRRYGIHSRELKRFKNDEEFFKRLSPHEPNHFFVFFPDGVSISMRQWIENIYLEVKDVFWNNALIKRLREENYRKEDREQYIEDAIESEKKLRKLGWESYLAYLGSLTPVGQSLRLFNWSASGSGWSFSRYFFARDYASAKKLLLESQKTDRFDPKIIVETIPIVSEVFDGATFDICGGEYW
jgi:hypothetical protein